MSTTNPWKTQQSFTKNILAYVIYAIIPLALLHFYLYAPSNDDHFSISKLATIATTYVSSSSQLNGEPKSENYVLDSVSQSYKEMKKGNEIASSICDYTNGEWVKDIKGPLYNGTSCKTIKDGQNCLNHGRPDKGYLYWRWMPRECKLPRFEPETFLQILQGKHLAFVGDSMARNQLESLLCMLSSYSPSNLVYSNGDDNQFRRWHFPSHNVNVSVYWSPFLVKGVERTHDGKQAYNKIFLDLIDERWGFELDSIDMLVLSIGHWYLNPSVYFDGDIMLGCHAVDTINCTEIGFFDVFGKALNTTLKAIIERKLRSYGNKIDIIVTTFSPHHFEGDWDKFGACPKSNPYMEDEKSLEGMDAEMRRVEVQEVENAKNIIMIHNNNNNNNNNNIYLPNKVRLATLDITKLALLRPDGHPGPYMYPSPFDDGVKEHVPNDCVHWCMPGPIDTWNEILLDFMKKWQITSMR